MFGGTGDFVTSLRGLIKCGATMRPTVQPVSQEWERSAITVTSASIATLVSVVRLPLPVAGKYVYREVVPRTDENGKQLKALLDYLLDGEVEAREIYEALGISSSTYYRRIKEGHYPDAEELRRVADRFNLSYPDLQVRFGLMSRQEMWSYVESVPFKLATATETVTTPRPAKLSELKPRQDAPPL